MALQTNFEFHGVTIPNAYIRIDRVQGGKDSGWSGVACVYKNIDSFTNKERAITEIPLPIPPLTAANISAAKAIYPNASIGDAIDIEPFNPDVYAVLYSRLKLKYPLGTNI